MSLSWYHQVNVEAYFGITTVFFCLKRWVKGLLEFRVPMLISWIGPVKWLSRSIERLQNYFKKLSTCVFSESPLMRKYDMCAKQNFFDKLLLYPYQHTRHTSWHVLYNFVHALHGRDVTLDQKRRWKHLHHRGSLTHDIQHHLVGNQGQLKKGSPDHYFYITFNIQA